MEKKRLYRSERERLLGGVCGGLAEYFGLDPTLVRLIFVLLALAGGFGLIIYLVLWIITPRQPHPGPVEAVVKENLEEIGKRAEGLGNEVSEALGQRDRTGTFWLGVALVVLGLVFLLANLGIPWWKPWRFVWPLALVVLGLVILLRRR